MRVVASCLLIACLAVTATATAEAGKKLRAYTARLEPTFRPESGPAHGLHLVLTAPSRVDLDDATGHAGPFRGIKGNDSNQIVLTDPEAALTDGVTLVIHTRNHKVRIRSWWWLDERGKRLGPRQRPGAD